MLSPSLSVRCFLLSLTLMLELTTLRVMAQPRPTPAGRILQDLKKLDVVGSVLYVAAHPDDENTLMLAYLANERHVRTGYLSLTRGDGGQNLIGTEQGEQIGVIRTQELMQARRVDGAEQFFSRAYDFGFSKTTDETLQFWGHDRILSDIVWMIRKFRPDVLITRFPPDARAGHGNHSASGLLTEEAFKLAGDPTKFPEQLKYVTVWQPKRVVWNTYSPGFTNQKPSENQFISVDISGYNPLLGESYTEMAAESRSMHKSQAMGSAKSRTTRIDYLVHKAGEPATQDLFDGVDLTWKRVKGGETVEPLVQQAIAGFRADNPAASLPALTAIYRALDKLDAANAYVQQKKGEVKTLIAECAGLWFETNPVDFAATPGETTKLAVSVVNRSNAPIKLVSVTMPAVKRDTMLNLNLTYNTALNLPLTVTIPTGEPLTQPYWLASQKEKGAFVVNDQQLIGYAENPPLLTTVYVFSLDGLNLTYTQPWIHKYVTAEDGELYRPFEVRPVVTANLAEKVYVFADTKRPGEPDGGSVAKTVSLLLKAGRANVSGTARLQVPAGWQAEPAQVAFTLAQKFQEQTISFTVKPTTGKTIEATLRAVMTVNGQEYTQSLVTIEHPHIRPQTLFPPAEAKLVKLDIRVKAKTIGYIAGAGDEIPAALRQIGCTVTLLSEADLQRDLSQYDAIVVGVRAYNTEERLLMYQPKLMTYVENGGTMLVQYQVNRRLLTENIGPYPFKITSDRITNEDAPVTFTKPDSPILTSPNKLTAADFTGWIQERGIYFADQLDPHYETLLSMQDPGETPKENSLIHATYGKGHFFYTGLVFFRELPAGVPGAYRLFANLISVGK